MRKIIRRFFLGLLVLLLLMTIWQHELIGYGISQGIGQLKIVWNARPVEEVLKDESFPDSLKQKIILVQDIRQFSFDSLGLNKSDNYTTVYNQHGKPVLWVLTACEPFQLKAKEWKFPFLGNVSYKGFFSLEKAKIEEQQLIQQGFDTSVDEVGGWSTLGWFKDPILTNMLYRKEGSLADLITHELTHGTLYVKDNVDFNENLASFVGEKGALRYLLNKYGKESEQYHTYVKGKEFRKRYTRLVLRYAAKLDALYKGFNPDDKMDEKLRKKQAILNAFQYDLDNLINELGRPRKAGDEEEKINNTYFMDVKRYRENLGYFEKEFTTKFNSDFIKYLSYLKNKYPSL